MSVVARVDVPEPMMAGVQGSLASLGAAVASQQGDLDGELRVCSAACMCEGGLVRWEGATKCPPDVRAELETSCIATAKSMFGVIAKAHTADSVAKVIARVVELLMLEQDGAEGISVGCGAAYMLASISMVFTKPLATRQFIALRAFVMNLTEPVD